MCGKSFYCDYCECFMKNDVNVRKNHNIGMSHNVAKANYLQAYKDPEQIITEEKKKIPCKRFLNQKLCQFGFFCRYSHYSPEELTYLEWLGVYGLVIIIVSILIVVLTVNKRKCCTDDEKELTGQKLRWKYPSDRKALPELTPSMQIIDFNKITEPCFVNQWG